MTDLSFIIPAYNEECFIASTVTSIKENTPNNIQFEIIVIDHGSLDQTAVLAKGAGAVVLNAPLAKTISELRNMGVQHSSGNILVFVDADTSLSKEWKVNIIPTLTLINENSFLLTGSKRIIPETANWFNKAWHFTPSTLSKPGHLGGGHMIMARSLFDIIGGFSTDYETGEDFEICARARRHGAKIISNPKLVAIHRGMPKSLAHFLKREIWHGRGDTKSITNILSSKVSILSFIFILAHACLLVGLLNPASPIIFIIFSLVLILSICLLSSILKTKAFRPEYLFSNMILFYLYFWGRAFSVLSNLIRPENRKHARNT